MSLPQRPTAKGKKTKIGLETDLVFAKNGVKNYNKAEQRKLDERTRKFEENFEQRKKSIRYIDFYLSTETQQLISFIRFNLCATLTCLQIINIVDFVLNAGGSGVEKTSHGVQARKI